MPMPELQIDFLTVHKSKGLEADNVIILNFKNDTLGFPNQNLSVLPQSGEKRMKTKQIVHVVKQAFF